MLNVVELLRQPFARVRCGQVLQEKIRGISRTIRQPSKSTPLLSLIIAKGKGTRFGKNERSHFTLASPK
jgi:hypothetical protein